MSWIAWKVMRGSSDVCHLKVTQRYIQQHAHTQRDIYSWLDSTESRQKEFICFRLELF